VIDRLRRLGVSAVVEAMTETTKTIVYRKLRARLVARELELYPQPELLSELRRIRTRFAAGRARVEIPRIGGSHGDIAQALGLACWRLRTWTGSGQPGLDLDDDSNRRGRPRGDRLELLERIVPLLVDEPILSANEILAIVRGRRADVLRVVAVLRAAERVGASDRA
jgi:hypothetical protein